MRELSTARYGPLAQALIERARREGRPGALAFGPPAADVRGELASMSAENLSPGKRVRMPQDFECLKAALWLRYDFMAESHAISQGTATPSGSYWHAILHRREPDASNARYWFSRVGEHPVFAGLSLEAKEIVGPQPPEALKPLLAHDAWDPDEFVKLCTSSQEGVATQCLLELQRREWELLFDYNYTKAFAR